MTHSSAEHLIAYVFLPAHLHLLSYLGLISNAITPLLSIYFIFKDAPELLAH